MGGTFGNFGSSGAPGFVDPFSLGAISTGLAGSQQIMQNRYNQLGMGGSTPEAMDLGQLPSVTGGIPGQFFGIAGELQNSSTGLGQQNIASQIGPTLSAFSK